MTSWVVSAHATSYSTSVAGRSVKPLVHLPPGIRLYFFENEGVPLSVAKAWTLYNLLMTESPASSVYTDIASVPGYQMFNDPALPDYSVVGDNGWIDQHGQCASGIFKMQDEHHRDPMTMYIRSGQNYSLSQFFADPAMVWKPGDQIYWLACRSWA